jgi:transposase InsO family protein
LSPFDFEIAYRPGKTNPADAPSRRPDYGPEVGRGVEDLLPTFQNKMRGTLMKSLSTWVIGDSGTEAAMGRTITACVNVTVTSIMAGDGGEANVPTSRRGEEYPRVLRGDTQEQYQGDATVTSVEAEACGSQAMPRMCARVCAASETALEEPTDSLQDLLLVLQRGDAYTVAKVKELERSHKVSAALTGPWSKDARGLLRRDNCIFVPDDASMKHELLRIHHDDPLAGHFGIEKTAELLRRKFYWQKQFQDVEDYVLGCASCQRNKPLRHRPYGELASLPYPSRPWKEITMDFITGLPESTHRGAVYDSILVVMDRYTKMGRYVPCNKTVDAEELADIIMDEVIRPHGIPEGIVTDRGSVFTSSYWSNICYHLKIKRKLSTAFHPQTDGQTERQNQTVEAYLRAYCNDERDDWARKLWMAEFSYNNSWHSSIKMSPFRAFQGYDHELPALLGDYKGAREVPAAKERIAGILKARETLKRNWTTASLQQAKQYNKRHTPMTFGIGDWVLLSSKNLRLRAGKLAPKMIGPFKVTDIVGTQAYKLALPPLYSRIHPVFHVSLLELARLRNEDMPDSVDTPELEDEDSEDEWEIESLVGHRKRVSGTQYLVRWKGWSKEYDEWVHENFLAHAKELVDEYQQEDGGVTQAKRQRKRKR